jgi:hypothetical protein
MSFFGNIFAAELVARLFYNADKEVRREIINANNVLEINEPERVSALCTLIRKRLSNNPFIRSISVQAHARDTTQRDALFVFRYKDEIKVGIAEAKLLRIKNANLNDVWDWLSHGESHFTKQIIDQQRWIHTAAVWEMFIPDCALGVHHPPLDRLGSSNIWANEIRNHAKINNRTQLWTYHDVLNATNEYMSLYTVVKEILRCNKGIKLDASNADSIQIATDNGRRIMNIPIPRSQTGYSGRVKSFLSEHEEIGSLSYYRFDELAESIEDYKSNEQIKIPDIVRSKSSFKPKMLEEYRKEVELAFNEVKDQM